MAEEFELPPFLPMTRDEMAERGWEELDVIFVTGDAYVDHPSFAPALLGRLLEAKRFRVGVIARPSIERPDDIARLGEPRLFFAVSAGAVDSMINNYTAQKHPRRTDAYAPGGRGGGRPNRATIVYCNMIRRAFGKSVAVLAGGIEPSLRRFAHYDFQSDAIRRPILLDAPADVMVYGMGERPIEEIAQAMRSRMAREHENVTASELLVEVVRKVRGVVYNTAASEPPPKGYHALPCFEKICKKHQAQVQAFKQEIRFRETGVYQDCAGHRVIANPPPAPLITEEMDAIYALRFRRQAHHSYTERVPALEQVQFSVTSHRGCFGGCSFCGLFTHQGKIVQSRSRASILAEISKEIVRHPEFKGTVSDIGGPTANMWGLGCSRESACSRTSCLALRRCPDLQYDQLPYVRLLAAARKIEGVKHVFVSTGVRMDLALQCEPFLEALAKYYTSGHVKVAPEHIVPSVLQIMMKPDGLSFIEFLKKFRRASSRAGKEQYVLPYFIAAHPGARLEDAIELALFLKRERLRVEQCQIFTPLPGTASAIMYNTGINPFTDKPVYVERDMRRREMHKALVLYHLPQSANLIREALLICDRTEIEPVLVRKRSYKRKPPRSLGGRVAGAHKV